MIAAKRLTWFPPRSDHPFESSFLRCSVSTPKEFAMHLDFLKELLNGPLYSVVTFANERFSGKLIEFAESHSSLRGLSPGDVFILIVEGSLELTVIPPTRGEKADPGDCTRKRVLKTGDVFYLPLQFGHRVNVPPGSTHAIAHRPIHCQHGIWDYEGIRASIAQCKLPLRICLLICYVVIGGRQRLGMET